MKGYWTLLLLVGAGRFLAFVARMNIVPFYAELMSSYGATYTGAGALFSAFFVGYSLTVIPAGIAADRYPPLRQIALGLMLLALSAGTLVIAPSYVTALAARALEGLSVAAIYTASLKLVAVSIASKSRGKAMGLMEVATGFGMFTALSALPFLNRWVDYRGLLLALPVLCGAILLLIPFTRNAIGTANAPRSTSRPRLRAVMNQDLLFITATSLLGLFTVNGILGWLPTHLTAGLGHDKAAAGVFTAVILGAQMLGVYPAGMISDRLGRRLPLVHVGSVLLLVGVLGLLSATGGVVLYGAMVSLGLGMAFAMAPLMVLTTEHFVPEQAGLVAAITIAVAQAGSGLAGVLFGWVLDLTGSFRSVWVLAAVLIVCRFVTASFIHERPKFVPQNVIS